MSVDQIGADVGASNPWTRILHLNPCQSIRSVPTSAPWTGRDGTDRQSKCQSIRSVPTSAPSVWSVAYTNAAPCQSIRSVPTSAPS